MIARHLQIRSRRSGRVLCGTVFSVDSIREREWVTCPNCQRIIASYHPGVDLTRLFKNPMI